MAKSNHLLHNDTGQFLAKTQIEVDYFAYIRIAVSTLV